LAVFVENIVKLSIEPAARYKEVVNSGEISHLPLKWAEKVAIIISNSLKGRAYYEKNDL
jgi:hypothetical protein